MQLYCEVLTEPMKLGHVGRAVLRDVWRIPNWVLGSYSEIYGCFEWIMACSSVQIYKDHLEKENIN